MSKSIYLFFRKRQVKKTVLYAKVILDMSNSKIDRVFDYEIPFEFLDKAETGMRVKVPFGKKTC